MQNQLPEIFENDLKRVCVVGDVKVECREGAQGRAGYDIVVIGGRVPSLCQVAAYVSLGGRETQLTRLVRHYVGRAVQEIAYREECTGAYSHRSRAGKAERWR